MENKTYIQLGIWGAIVVNSILLAYFISKNKSKLIAYSSIIEIILASALMYIKW